MSYGFTDLSLHGHFSQHSVTNGQNRESTGASNNINDVAGLVQSRDSKPAL